MRCPYCGNVFTEKDSFKWHLSPNKCLTDEEMADTKGFTKTYRGWEYKQPDKKK